MRKKTAKIYLSATEKEKKELQMDALKGNTSVSKLLLESYKELKKIKNNK